MVSTSGIRGVIGSGLEPVIAAGYAAAFGTYLKRGRVVIGRDSRPSGEMFKKAVIAGLQSVGRNVVDIGIVPTPTLEIAIPGLRASGGICLTASHNPSEWNALKLFNGKGEFINKNDLKKLREIYENKKFGFADYRKLGTLTVDDSWIDRHIKEILKLKIINRNRIKRAGLKVVVDAVNGAGSLALPELLERLGVKVYRINCKNDGDFVRKPEPVPANLRQLSAAVKKQRAHLGMACDPDADRLALVDETGRPIGEELTLALAVKYVLLRRRGKVVINLSTSRVTADVAASLGAQVYHTPVGEANVVAGMKKYRSVIGGEGNGGVIFPAFHAGRDALVGGAIIAALLAESRMSLSGLVGTLPIYYNIKTKATLPAGFDKKLRCVEKWAAGNFTRLKIDRRDGLRFDFSEGWFQIRKSNTEPIFRLIVETSGMKLSREVKNEITDVLK